MATIIEPDEELTSVEREGLVWLNLLSSGKATAEDLTALERWQQQDAVHAEAFARAVRLHRMLGTPGLAETPDYKAPIWERPQARRAVLGGAIATAAAYLVVRPPLELWSSLAELSADYRTGIGQRQQVALAQGVTLDLNTQTSIGRRTEAGRSGITLISGEIAAVAKLPQAQSFYAYVGDSRIAASDASFNLRTLDDGACLTCVAGSLRVQAGADQMVLTSSEQVTFSNAGIRQRQMVDTAAIMAWKHGLLIFHDATVSSIVAEVNRYRSGKIIVMTSALANRTLNASLRIDQVDKVVSYLEGTANASATTLPGGVVLLS